MSLVAVQRIHRAVQATIQRVPDFGGRIVSGKVAGVHACDLVKQAANIDCPRRYGSLTDGQNKASCIGIVDLAHRTRGIAEDEGADIGVEGIGRCRC